jgi:hypothetical protein
MRLFCTAFILAAATVGATPPCPGDRGGTPAPLATDGELSSYIRDLGHPSYETRSRATRLLCAAGMAAYEPLQAAAAGDDVETALRAKDILSTLDRLMFSGVDVSFGFSEAKASWDTPVELRLTMSNRSRHPARVPFVLDPALRDGMPEVARQVADMLDLAEWLTVRGPDGDDVQLRVDDIAADPAIEQVVAERVDGGPASTIAPGGQAVVVLKNFNRGWARYPLLDAGTYTLVFDYVPAWEDAALAKEQAGRVRAEPVSIEVYRAAPPAVSRHGEEVSVRLVRSGDALVAELTNRFDQPLLLNKNFGPVPPFAQGRWICEIGSDLIAVPASGGPARSWADFDKSLLVEVAPGASEELDRRLLPTLRQRIADSSRRRPAACQVHFSYSSLCDGRWQMRQGQLLLGNAAAPPVLRDPLPLHLRAIWQRSDVIVIQLGE